jgi:hypothetical protein
MLHTVLPLLRDIVHSETQFFNRVMDLPDAVRNRVLANRNRQTLVMLDLIRTLAEPPSSRGVVTRGTRSHFTIDLTQDLLNTFHDPVPVLPTAAQISAAVELAVTPPAGELCAICQENMATSTRLNHCRHYFHHNCITQWFGTSVRCPVCRNDIRENDEEEE